MTRIGLWCPIVAALAGGCTGVVASDPNGSSEGSGATWGVPGGKGSGGSGSGVDPNAPATDPGRVTLHRLNRAEYDNTVRDLMGTAQKPSVDFPIDDRGSGFDNIADVLTLSPLHIATYNDAAQALVDEALASASQRARILTCDPAAGGNACAQTILAGFAGRAWRRPATADEVARLMIPVTTAVAQGDSYEQGLALALRAVLLSPHFVFRVELDPDPTSLTPHPLGDYELASRLSYFLWSSMPDDALFASAEAGNLGDPATLAGHVTRMLADSKAQALIENFAGQWLYLRSVDMVEPDPVRFPEFDDELRAAMKQETALLFGEVAFGGLAANQLLTADFTFLNDRLASHYGLPAVGSSELTRVSLAGSAQRKGLLSHASFLTFTSHPNRTSPVNRGKWVMDELLCSVIPPPPPDVDTTLVESGSTAGMSQRQILEQHRADPTCAGCHSLMDPIGLGLENYDAIGRYRTLDGTAPIDAAGALPTGEPFTGPLELADLVAARPDFASCVARKLYTYALGRAPDPSVGHLDTPTLEALAQEFVESGYSLPALIAAIVQSPTFLNRRGEP